MIEKNEEELVSMSLGDHLQELQSRLILALSGAAVGIVACLFFGKKLVHIIIKPYLSAVEKAGLEPSFLAIQPSEQFMVFLKTSLVFGIIFTAPWLFYHAWKFISSGLYRHERRFVHVVVPACATLFVAGALFFIIIIAPICMTFFIRFTVSEYVRAGQYGLSDYVTFVLSLTLIFGLAFQMPVAIVFAEQMGLVKIAVLTSIRKYVLLVLVVISAIVTPPDVISQIALATPLYILYEGSILVCRFLRARKKDAKKEK
jgi:sec-independent protein translocase protein TatC